MYSAPIVATGDGPFDVVHHANTGDRVLGIHIAGPSAPGQFAESWVDLLFVKGFDAGQPIVYISTDAGQPLTSVLERSTYVPALDKAAYNGGDDFLGSARERLFGFINGQTGTDNKESQGFVHLVKDGHASEDASAGNTALINALRNGGDLLNVFGDFPTEKDPRHAQAYSPLWDAQLGLWTDKAVKQGLNKRQIDEVQVFNLAATRPDLLTGVNPATGQPAPYGSVGVDINCAVIGFIDKAPTANLADPVPNSQFPPANTTTETAGLQARRLDRRYLDTRRKALLMRASLLILQDTKTRPASDPSSQSSLPTTHEDDDRYFDALIAGDLKRIDDVESEDFLVAASVRPRSPDRCARNSNRLDVAVDDGQPDVLTSGVVLAISGSLARRSINTAAVRAAARAAGRVGTLAVVERH